MEKGWCGHCLGPAADHHRAAPAPEAASGAGDARWVSSGLDEGGWRHFHAAMFVLYGDSIMSL